MLQGKSCIFTCPKDWHFSWKMNTIMSVQNVGSHFPCDLFFASEGKTTSKKTVFLFLCSFFLTNFEFTNRLREKKRAELNETALSVDDILLRASGVPRAGGHHQLPGCFFPGLFHNLVVHCKSTTKSMKMCLEV